MAVESIEYPINLAPLKKKIKALEEKSNETEAKVASLEVEVEKLKPKEKQDG